jgi:pimeloyl-ACP methyl ester carboxylesterase
MKSPRLVCLHGSPGSGRDFTSLTRELEALGAPLKVEAPARPGYPGAGSTTELRLNDGDWILGYSWGAAVALDLASRTKTKIGGVILVAPYLFPEKPLSGFARLLLRAPVVSDLLLAAMRAKIEAKLLTETSAPLPPSPAYREDIQSVMTTGHLRAAALEKEDVDVRFLLASPALPAFRQLQQIPLLVIASSGDLVAPIARHVAPVVDQLAQAKSVTIENAGHCLPWQKPAELARIISDFISERLSQPVTTSQILLEEIL